MDKELAENSACNKSTACNENGDVGSKLTPTQISKLFVGNVRHRRFSPKAHNFNYPLYMLGLDVDQVTHVDNSSSVFSKLFGTQWYKPLRFKQEDYLRGEPGDLKQRIVNKISTLGGHDSINKVIMLVQVRCFGVYFSPANFYFAYSNQGNCLYMLVEVSNTPWNKRHYYLVDMANITPTEKDFHVSPFMDLAMQYHWRVSPPNLTEHVDTKPIKSDKKDKLLIHIENISHQQQKLFDATLALKGQAINRKNLMSVMRRFPAMTLTVVTGIYVQALKLFIKRIPFVPYQRKAQKQEL
ncbi:DUF1365 domain-containing protein [Thalassotalea euphylliae]|uniref:DUF1365 domain-containing protein n=1 Tax=Thalassotalea euphylliae TaxID=1655234 RepID=A0A3E0TYT3_9GAMM|nr:DUF1365 domain-containing protein [Thalassotalea euphylliae]REL29533.1 DUF1365 domain-containing protein [Thalassotalea euphylliae]